MNLPIIFQFITILLISVCFIGFLIVSLIFFYNFMGYDYEPVDAKEDKPSDEIVKTFNSGIERGVSIVFVSAYRMWKDNNYVPIVGDFDVIKNDLLKSLNDFKSDPKLLDSWVDDYNAYIKNNHGEPTC